MYIPNILTTLNPASDYFTVSKQQKGIKLRAQREYLLSVTHLGEPSGPIGDNNARQSSSD